MEPEFPRLRFNPWSDTAPMEASMRRTLMTVTALTVFALGMSASMAQQQNPARITTPSQTTPPAQTQPSQPPNLNTSKNPYDQKKYMQTPVQQPNKK
jgi:hypothetical protein